MEVSGEVGFGLQPAMNTITRFVSVWLQANGNVIVGEARGQLPKLIPGRRRQSV